MTSLKVKDANEIAEAMAKALGGDLFKEASLKKEAMGALETKLVGFITASKVKPPTYDVWMQWWNAYFGGGDVQSKFSAEMYETYKGANADVKINEYRNTVDALKPKAADDQAAEDVEQDAKCPEGCDCAKCACADDQPAPDENTVVALDFAMGHLIKVADALDKKGFAGVARMVDETIEKLAAKKSKKSKKEKEKEEKKEKAEKKKKKKEEKEKKEKEEKKK